jgi:hypothetical protein
MSLPAGTSLFSGEIAVAKLAFYKPAGTRKDIASILYLLGLRSALDRKRGPTAGDRSVERSGEVIRVHRTERHRAELGCLERQRFRGAPDAHMQRLPLVTVDRLEQLQRSLRCDRIRLFLSNRPQINEPVHFCPLRNAVTCAFYPAQPEIISAAARLRFSLLPALSQKPVHFVLYGAPQDGTLGTSSEFREISGQPAEIISHFLRFLVPKFPEIIFAFHDPKPESVTNFTTPTCPLLSFFYFFLFFFFNIGRGEGVLF